MTERTVTHNTFVIERIYPATPARVFAAWAKSEAKTQWFGGPEEWGPEEHQLDFRIGGREISRGGPKSGPIHHYEATYQDIVPNERIIYSYEMYLDDMRISVSLATIELIVEDTGTRLILTEQGAYLGSSDNPAEREHGMGVLLDQLGAALAANP